MTDQNRGPARWSVEQRLAFAANRVFWDGSINRDDLVRRFGVSPNQATGDLARLRALRGDGLAYDVSRRAYIPTQVFGDPPANADAVLHELRLIAEGYLDASAAILSMPPPLALAEAPVRSVETPVLHCVLDAMRDQSVLVADYVSFQRPDVSRRFLSPHALVFDGFRWHVRAHDATDGHFKDFVLARLSALKPHGKAFVDSAGDTDWNTFVGLAIKPHPELTAHQARVIEIDYGMADGVLTLNVRRAVEFYVRRRLGLVDGHERRSAQEQHIILSKE